MQSVKILALCASVLCTSPSAAQSCLVPNPVASKKQMEHLDRGLVVVRGQKAGQYFASWRLLGTEPASASFTLLRDGKTYSTPGTGATSCPVDGTPTSRWQVVADYGKSADRSDEMHCDTSDVVLPWTMPYLKLSLSQPSAVSYGNVKCTYTPNDCSAGDVDGDGKYELFVKWSPSNEHDNSQGGITGNVYIDCYRVDLNAHGRAELLWRVDLGPNIRAGAHYTQFLVYDFDGDGCAEMICKTAPGTRDGRGRFVSDAADVSSILSVDNSRDWRNSNGRVTGGQEYLTVFDGRDGHAVSTVFFQPDRDGRSFADSSWQGSSAGGAAGTLDWNTDHSRKQLTDNAQYGNRGERYLAAVAFLGGSDANPSAVFTRGYYSYAFAWAVDYDGSRLYTRWLHSSIDGSHYSVADSSGRVKSFEAAAPTSGGGSGTLFANGNHNLSVADVDGDGRDELLWGSAALDDNGRVLYATGFGHGDAMHVADLSSAHRGLEVFDVHEMRGRYAWDVHSASTGEILLKGGPAGVDNGRGLAAYIDSMSNSFCFWSADDGAVRSAADGRKVTDVRLPVNFRIFWDGDYADELLDGTEIRKWGSDGLRALGIFGDVNADDFNALRPADERPADENMPVDGDKGDDAGRMHRPGGRCPPFMPHHFRRSVSFAAGMGSPAANNWTKNNPCLQADLFGDWREELIFRDSTDPSVVYMYTTQIPTQHRVVTLMHDHLYRMGIAWQNVGYNQPPHVTMQAR